MGWDELWPLLPVGFGLLFVIAYFVGGLKDGGLAFLGTGLVLTGAFFLGFKLTPGLWEWSEMARLWPIFPLIWGSAFVVSYLAERRKPRDRGALVLGLIAMVVGLVVLGVTHGKIDEDIVQFWPLLIVAIGIYGLFVGLARTRQRK
jgi:peptidoglycan/LPS O-acetylase OafA/YrhL